MSDTVEYSQESQSEAQRIIVEQWWKKKWNSSTFFHNIKSAIASGFINKCFENNFQK